MHGLPKLVANISSQLHHLQLVNTSLTVGSLVKWLPIKVAHTCKLHNSRGLLLVSWSWFQPIVIAFNTLCPWEFYIEWCGALHGTHWAHTLKIWFVPALEINFLKKLPQLAASEFFKVHISVVENYWTIIFYHIIIAHIEHIFENITYITKKDKILATNWYFLPDYLIMLITHSFTVG